MKRPQPDLAKVIVDKFIAKTGSNRKLKRLWGTETIDGVEVLKGRVHYHKKADRPDNYEKLFKFLGVYNDVKDYEGEGIKSAWFTLNKSNGPEYASVHASFIADNLNKLWWDSNDGEMPENLSLTTTVVIKGSFSGLPGNSRDYSLSTVDLAQSIIDDYETLWLNNVISQEGVGVINKGTTIDDKLKIEVPGEDDLSPDDPWLAILSRYVLRDSGIPCTIKDVEVGLENTDYGLQNTTVVTIEIPYHEFIVDDMIVTQIAYDIDTDNFPLNTYRNYSSGSSLTNKKYYSNESITQSDVKKVTFYETVDDIDVDVITRSYTSWEDATIESSFYENFWVKSTDSDIWYFKADVIDNPKLYGTTHQELNDYLFSLLDTGYKKKKIPVWKKIVALIVFIVAVVITYFSWGTTSGWTGPIMAAAYAIIVGAVVVSLLTMLFSSLGMTEWAMAFAAVSRDIEPLVSVASIVIIVMSFGTQNWSAALTGYLKREAIAYIFEEVFQEFGGFASLVADAFSGKLSGNSLSTLNRSIDAYMSVQLAKLENISDRNADLQAEYDKLAEESSMETDVFNSYLNIYTKPATADWSIYASTYDLPYERAGGAMSMGNIQKTTKQAIRKAEYQEDMFDGMLFV